MRKTLDAVECELTAGRLSTPVVKRLVHGYAHLLSGPEAGAADPVTGELLFGRPLS